jgi:hypothetical protein
VRVSHGLNPALRSNAAPRAFVLLALLVSLAFAPSSGVAGGAAGASGRAVALVSPAPEANVTRVAFALGAGNGSLVEIGYSLTANLSLTSGEVDAGTSVTATVSLRNASPAELSITVLGSTQGVGVPGLGATGSIPVPGLSYSYFGAQLGIVVTTSAVLALNVSTGGADPTAPIPLNWSGPANLSVPIHAGAAAAGTEIPLRLGALAYTLQVGVNATGDVPLLGNVSIPLLAPRSLGSIAGSPGSLETNYTVVPRPAVSSFLASPSPAPLGTEVTLSASVSGGVAPLSYRYGGLPPGCEAVAGPTVRCTPNSTGSFRVNVTATDAEGLSANGSVTLTVGTAATTSSGGSPYGPFGSAAVLALVIGAVAVGGVAGGVLLGRRGKRGGAAPPTSEGA